MEIDGECNSGPGQNTGLSAVDMEGDIAAIHADKTTTMEMNSERGSFRDRIRNYLKKKLDKKGKSTEARWNGERYSNYN